MQTAGLLQVIASKLVSVLEDPYSLTVRLVVPQDSDRFKLANPENDTRQPELAAVECAVGKHPPLMAGSAVDQRIWKGKC